MPPEGFALRPWLRTSGVWKTGWGTDRACSWQSLDETDMTDQSGGDLRERDKQEMTICVPRQGSAYIGGVSSGQAEVGSWVGRQVVLSLESSVLLYRTQVSSRQTRWLSSH